MRKAEKRGQLVVGRIRSLPTEVIAEIFGWCLPTASERLETPLVRLAPLALTCVCREWRSLCLSLPSLWTELAIGHRGTDPGDDARLVELWKSRSGYLPISFKLFYETHDALHPVLFHQEKERYKASMQQLIQIALSCADRWSSFEIHTLDISVLDQIFLAVVTRGSPRLKHLSLSTKYLGFFGDEHFLDFSLCPSLRSICLRTPMISPVVGSDSMKNMTNLELRFCSSIEDCLRWIDICPALENLTVRLFCSSLDTLSDEIGRLPIHNPRCLPRLKYIEVHGFSNEVDIGPLLDILDVPALTNLTINMYNMIEIRDNWTNVLELLRRSEPPLSTLQLLGTPMTIVNIVDCLHLVPRLKKLSIGSHIDTDVLLEALSVIPNSSKEQLPSSNPLCPILNTLDLVNSSWSMDLLASMLSSRYLAGMSQTPQNRQPVTAIEELYLEFEDAQVSKEHPIIMQCISQGLKIIGSRVNSLMMEFAADPDVVFV